MIQMITFGDTVLIDSGTMNDLRTIAPIFITMGMVFIGAYLAPVVLSKLDNWEHNDGVEAE